MGCTEEGGGCAGRGGGEMLLGEITDMHLGGLSLVSGWVSLEPQWHAMSSRDAWRDLGQQNSLPLHCPGVAFRVAGR